MKPKAAIYDPYLDTLGGGERYCLTFAEILIKHGYSVDLFWSGSPDTLKRAKSRFNLNIDQVNLVPDIFHIAIDDISLFEDSQSIKNAISKTVSQKNIFIRVLNIFKNLLLTQKYDVMFYLSDGSLPFILGKTNILHAQVPLNLKFTNATKLLNRVKLLSFKHIICNSTFTAKVIEKVYSKKSAVLYPPVDVNKFETSDKEKYIISVGRFDNILNAKKQDILIKAFSKLIQNSPSKQWKLILAGGSTEDPSKNTYLKHLKFLSNNLPVEFYVNPDFSQLKTLYSKSSIYWHAAGFDVDETLHPENTEHFGITVVEGMASGAVPVVVAKGGLPEIVKSNENGFLWSTMDELIAKTQLLISDPQLMLKLSKQSRIDAQKYSKDNFENELLTLLHLQ